jgi:ABC-type uncharacterized transport system YnjBCD ATPase subunit
MTLVLSPFLNGSLKVENYETPHGSIINFSVNEGGILLLKGPSGCGTQLLSLFVFFVHFIFVFLVLFFFHRI